jgi:hypothetical protein
MSTNALEQAQADHTIIERGDIKAVKQLAAY